MLTKLVYGNEKIRKSRFHDEKGNFIGWGKLLTHTPLAVSTGLLRISAGYRPEMPWIAYDAINVLGKLLSKKSRVLEFGSGMSTVWYAKVAGEVYSVEDNHAWYEKVDATLKERQLNNIHYDFAQTPTDYANFMADDTAGFDLIMVDGSYRSACIASAAKLLRPGGILYLDNSDKHSSSAGGDTRLAEARALALAQEKLADITYFTDFAPTQFFVQQGLMVRIPKS